MVIAENPIGTDGFEFVEFTSPIRTELEQYSGSLVLFAVGKHRHKDVVHYRQHDINFILNRHRKARRRILPGSTVPQRTLWHSVSGMQHMRSTRLSNGAQHPFRGRLDRWN